MAVIRSGASSTDLTVDTASLAARVTLYNTDGTTVAERVSYRAATVTSVIAVSGTGAFFVISGTASKTIRVWRLRVSGDATATIILASISVKKSGVAAFTGGTATALTATKLDSNDANSSGPLLQVYTAAPASEGTLVGRVGCNRHLIKSSTVAEGRSADVEWVFGLLPEVKPVVLRGVIESLSLAFDAAPGGSVQLAVEVEWTEE